MGQYTIKDIQDQTELLETDVQRIYRSIYTKLGVFPESLDRVPEFIIQRLSPSSTKEPLTITPSTTEQQFSSNDSSKYDPITVEPVTSAIDGNIQPENIKEGVSILGVTGTLSAGGGSSANIYDGSFDEDGLRAIGWTDEDIAYFEEANPHYAWQNDQYKVSEENKALYLLDDPNPDSYKNNPKITFVPNKNINTYFNSGRFEYMYYIKGIPFYSTSNNRVYYSDMFTSCRSLTTIPPLDISKATNTSGMFNGCTSLIAIPQINTSNSTNIINMFYNSGLKTIPQLDFSNATDARNLFQGCSALNIVPPINLSKVTRGDYVSNMFDGCTKLVTVEGIDFSGMHKVYDSAHGSYITSITNLFGKSTDMYNIKRFIINGKLNISISDNYSLNALTHIDYDSVKSILEAANRTDNTEAKKLSFNITMTDQNGELAALVSSCTSKKWTISGLTLK